MVVVRRHTLASVLVLLALVGTTGLMAANRLFNASKSLEILLTVFRDAMLLNVDEPDPAKLLAGGINGMLKELDPYALYIPEESTDRFQFLTTGDYAGIGALVQQGLPYTRIQQVYEGTPSALAGMRVGDSIVAIDGVDVRGMDVSAVSARLKGKAGSSITVRVRRPYVEDTLTFAFRRAVVHVPPVPYSYRDADGIGYVNLSTFTVGCTGAVSDALRRLSASGPLNGIVLDLRGNVGGLLEEAVKLTSLFIPPGDTVVVVRGRDSLRRETAVSKGAAPYANVPLAILVNRGSASSSEVVAGALQDMDRALIIGEQTFGKGLVQTTRPLPYGGIFKLTTAKYYTPSGRCIQALDYSHRDSNGAVGEVPDSLVAAFTTRHGRTVYDGGGIWPDVPLKSSKYSRFVSYLFLQQVLFDYATLYRSRHDSIPAPAEFRVNEDDMRGLLTFLHRGGAPAKSPLLELIKQMKDLAHDDDQYPLLEGYLDSASSAVVRSFDTYFGKNQTAISNLLNEEIVSRYYYEGGRIAKSLQHDTVFACARDYLLHPAKMDSILLRVSPPDPRASKRSSK